MMSSAQTTTTSSSTTPSAARDDWQNDLTLTESNRYMLENQLDCDVWFTLLPSGAAGGEELPVTVGAHRYMLVSRSPVFFAMLSGPLAARTPPSPSASQHRRHHHHQQQQHRSPRQDDGPSDSSTRLEIRITDITPNTFWQLLRCATTVQCTCPRVHGNVAVTHRLSRTYPYVKGEFTRDTTRHKNNCRRQVRVKSILNRCIII